ncbi:MULTISPECIES: 6-carboxytetrahydropterin synthase [unclassified Polaromonas]|uniref:6-pyruvoyl trahydropterin synthase family protein n=1 Tax=unclassified Polaromonas TaxID=2638319 RepID=UPI0018C976F8|nr:MULTISPECIES: 6-carboxytetrahydropterin synthase [unclassified Polaromonas]MBG6070407.1 6-pyruvoyltetrahydropterin/6-carboxytetrahydropterin synthase [Polaromonas sp. CG_9.7]MBG6112405.1 6-pyruvoyltetrahydropterin/6-carboxytetrahydropterin synthase [Polaromonas sp. CG_9.2]MDH6184052.1 6-pyruvoyltetrahydropterin/6-carboxytetrahydropterin synthase [Polaromonas sp. CG_23.6]
MNSIPKSCEISQSFYFDAAHTLERAIESASSKRIHGHTYNAEVFLTGQPDPATGMLIDLGVVRHELAMVREQLDHHLLDEVAGLGPPTLENLCQFIFSKLLPALPSLTSVRVWRVSMGDGCRMTRPL